MKMPINICLLFLGLVLILSYGCLNMVTWHVRYSTKANPEMSPPSGYQRDVVYELQHDVFLMGSETDKKNNRGFLVAPMCLNGDSPRIHSSPQSVKVWLTRDGDVSRWDGSWGKTNGIKDYDEILGVVEQGTRIKMLYMQIDHTISVWFGSTIYKTPMGMIENGIYSGWIVDMADISQWYPEKHIDNRLLKKVSL